MRLCMVLQDRVEPYLDLIISKLIILLNSISKVRFMNLIFFFNNLNKNKFDNKKTQNPSKPNFNHYLFETFGILIKAVCFKNPALIQKFEASLSPIVNYVLEQDITGDYIQSFPKKIYKTNLFFHSNIQNSYRTRFNFYL